MNSTPFHDLKSSLKRVADRMLPSLYYILWWLAALLIFLWFDILWCIDSDFSVFTRYRSLYFILPAAATLFTLPAILTRRWAWQFAVLAALSALLEANIIYFRTYYTHIPLSSYSLATNLNGFEGSVIEGMRAADFGFIIILAGACIIQIFCIRHPKKYNPLAYILLLSALVAINYSLFASRGGFRGRMEQLSGDVTALSVQPPVYTIFLPLLYEAMTAGAEPTQEKIEEARTWFEQHDAITARHTPADSAPRRNLVLILCESLESWPIGLSVEGREVTPFMNSLIADTANVYYNKYVLTQARAGRSIDGQLLYISGRYPLRNGVFAKDHAREKYYSLPKAMKETGAKTYIVSCDMPSTWNQAAFASAVGIDSLLLNSNWTMPEDEDWHDGIDILDHRLLERCVDRMKAGKLWPEDEKTFMLVVTHSGHNPFTLPPGLSPLLLKESYPEWLKNYIEVTAYVDAALEKFVNYIMSRPDAENTVVAITGDHEGLGTHRREIDPCGPYKYVDSGNHTPLILINSPYIGHGECEITQVDIYSALLDAIGLYNTYEWRGMGRSPFDPAYSGTSRAEADSALTVGDLWFQIPSLR